jgi:hypothetical protein
MSEIKNAFVVTYHGFTAKRMTLLASLLLAELPIIEWFSSL